MFDQARIHGMKQIDCFVYYNSNSKEADDDADDDIIFHDTFQVESANFDTDDDNDEPISYREIINKDFNTPTGFEEVTIVMVVSRIKFVNREFPPNSLLTIIQCTKVGMSPDI